MTALSVRAEPHDWPLLGPADPSTVALVAIDLQRDFLDDDGWFARTIGRDVANVRSVVPVVAALLTAARAVEGLHVVHTRQGNDPDLGNLPPVKREQTRRAGWPIGTQGRLGRGLIIGEPGWGFDPAVAPAPGERIVEKPGFSAFLGTDLDAWLRERGVTSLILCGVTANVCVLSALYTATDLGYDCLTVTDAIAGIDRETTATVHDLIRYQAGLFGSLAEAAVVEVALRVAAA